MSKTSPNAQRDQYITEARRNGTHSLRDLADWYKLSPERVRQIALRGGVDPAVADAAYERNKRAYYDGFLAQNIQAIVMRFMAGEPVADIAADLNVPVTRTQVAIDEYATDEILATRRANQTRARFPNVGDGPIEKHEPRNDRQWTYETVLTSLYYLATNHGGRLPSTSRYKELSTGNDLLPSFPTVRNRVGRWSQVRVLVNQMIRQAAA